MRLTRILRSCPLIIGVAAAAIVMLGSSPASTVARRLATRQQPLTRYSLVHGCYALHSPTGSPIAAADGPFRMQAAALGIYLLYEPQGDFLTDQGGGTLRSVSAPSTAAEWTVDGSATPGFTITNLATGTRLPVTFVPATGCATYPEAGVDAAGTPFSGASPEADTLGTVEGHAHITAFELFGGDWHCGRPWSPFGAQYALPASCAADEQGTNGEVESFLDFGGATRPAGMHGWPTFVDWPSPTALAEEGDYYTGVERAWKAGLRIFVTNLVDNEALCNLMTTKHNPCNDMASVQIQSRDLYGLENYIDAQSGGPGKGWFRIVTDPFQARRVINEGKLAVIEGVEVSRIFGCGENSGVPQCNDAQIDAGLKEVHNLGVRTFFPIHEFDNAFGGSKMIAGDTGVLINAGNREETGSFFALEPCPAQDQDAEQVSVPASGPLAQLANGPVASMLGGSPLPVYGSGPQCNTRGLTTLGSYVIKQMIKQHFIIQLDHMDSKTATAAVSIASAAHYSGVVSAHCCSSPQLFKQVYGTGGFISEPVGPATAFVATEKLDKSDANSKYHFGFGWGSDMNGLADQPGPSPATPITYPFKSYLGNVTFSREQWGQRTFDLNTDGLANYGMYADWLHDVQLAGGQPVMADMFQGAESYLETWERADGVPDTRCRSSEGYFSATGTRVLRLGASWESLLYSLGQPSSRPGTSFRYCVDRSAHGTIAAVFTAGGKAGLFTSTAAGYASDDVHPGQSARRLRGLATKFMPGAWLGRRLRGGARFLYGVSGGRVRYVGMAARSEVASRTVLRRGLSAAGVV